MTGTARGPCEQCEHLRDGKSLARAALAVVIEEYRPQLTASQTRQIEAEGQAGNQLAAELNNARQLRIDRWSRRPPTPAFRYCGVDEFSGSYYISEIKNVDQGCPQFTEKSAGAPARSCETCRHNILPRGRLITTVEHTIRRHLGWRDQMEKFYDIELAPALKAEAEGEYTECVAGAGFVSKKPMFMPWCEAWSASDAERYVVGPIVNGGSRCPRWEAGDPNDERQKLDVELDAVIARTEQVVGPFEADPSSGFGPRMEQAANAEGDLVAYCLASMGWERGFVESITKTYTKLSWGYEWSPRATPPPATPAPPSGPAPTPQAPAPSPPAGAADAGGSPPSLAPFMPLPNITYQHPSRPGVSLTIVTYPMQVVATVQVDGVALPYDLATLVPGVWTQLQSPSGPLPIVLLVELPLAVYASWL